ncbi:hypothetical protein NDU88_003303 [Pleurodeles waltl]|uniref:Uncharacterized protein n=1 Tax=Pleurodeles waltl TaxID=8319 RepID=A0AAV7SG67_PLEWA|nr:hypothetical protein NDU88_003303 [Pleurodeles waltl]
MLAPRPGVLHHHSGTQPLQAPQPLCHSLGGRWRSPKSGALTTLPSPGSLHLAPFAESVASVAHSTGRHTPLSIPDQLGGGPHPDPGAAPPAEPPAASAWCVCKPAPVLFGATPALLAPASCSPGRPFRGPRLAGPTDVRAPIFLLSGREVAVPRSRGRAPCWAISASIGIQMVWLQAGPTRSRARSSCPGNLQPNEAQSSGAPQPRSPSEGPPTAPLADRPDFAAAHVTAQGPGSGRGTGHQLLSPPVQLAPPETTLQGRDRGSAAPRIAPPRLPPLDGL